LQNPECVVYDPVLNLLYVSNTSGGGGGTKGESFISLVSLKAKVTNLKWVGGLNVPRSITLSGRILYVADNNRVVGIDVNKNAIVNTYSPEGAKMFNDVETNKKGDVYTFRYVGRIDIQIVQW